MRCFGSVCKEEEEEEEEEEEGVLDTHYRMWSLNGYRMCSLTYAHA